VFGDIGAIASISQFAEQVTCWVGWMGFESHTKPSNLDEARRIVAPEANSTQGAFPFCVSALNWAGGLWQCIGFVHSQGAVGYERVRLYALS